MKQRTLKGGVLVAACAFCAAPALAGIPSTVITIGAESSLGLGAWSLDLADPIWGAAIDSEGNFNFELSDWLAAQGMDAIEITDQGTGEVLAELQTLSVTYIADPVVSTNFSVQAIGADTRFTISSGPLTFPTIDAADAIGRASASMTVTDFFIPGSIGASGVNIVGEQAGGAIVSATYNGAIGTGSVFGEMLAPGLFQPVSGGSDVRAEDIPGGGSFLPIGEDVSDISIGFDFTLSAWDLASGNATFEVIPTPGAAILLGGGLLAARRRR
jgi:hypothetical protein